MRTVRVVHTTAANEAAGIVMLMICGVIAAIGVGIYFVAHRLFVEETIPFHQLEISWSEPNKNAFDADPFYGGGTAGPSTTRGRYDIEVDIRNRSPQRLYSIEYEATLHVCETIMEEGPECPIVETTTGQLGPDLIPGGHGLQKTQISFGKADNYIGYGRITMRWTSAHGVAP